MAKGSKTGGRQKGTPNKLTIEVKAAIEGALIAVGGQRYLERVARTHPQVFCTLIGRLVPKPLDVTMPAVSEEPVDMLDFARRIAFVLRKGVEEAKARANLNEQARASENSRLKNERDMNGL